MFDPELKLFYCRLSRRGQYTEMDWSHNFMQKVFMIILFILKLLLHCYVLFIWKWAVCYLMNFPQGVNSDPWVERLKCVFLMLKVAVPYIRHSHIALTICLKVLESHIQKVGTLSQMSIRHAKYLQWESWNLIAAIYLRRQRQQKLENRNNESNILQLIGLIGNRSVTWVGIKAAS